MESNEIPARRFYCRRQKVALHNMKCQVYKKSGCDLKSFRFQPGDFILTHGTSLFDSLIQLFTMSHWNHTALIVDSKGSIMELVEQGIRKHNIHKYDKQEVFIVRTQFFELDRKQILDYAYTMLKRHQKYGFFQIASITLKIITKSRLIIKLDGTQICSEFVANCLARGGIVWDSDASLITPADIYHQIIQGKAESTLS